MAAMKALMKPFASLQARHRTRKRARTFSRHEHSFEGLTNLQVFEKIYDDGTWGRDPDGAPLSGSGSHAPHIVEPYVASVGSVLNQLGTDITVVDLGCGDFNIGSRVAPFAGRYLACDIARSMVEMNAARRRFDHVEFRALDLTVDALPSGDVAIVKQVLQHLDNDSIKAFVGKINRTKPYRHLIVTEHVPAAENFVSNVDMPTGSWTRVKFGSGVDLEQPPFDLRFISRAVLCEAPEEAYGVDATIRTISYRLK
jgi:SAM-dependent methyltransferase